MTNSKPTILVVDDETTNLDIINKILENEYRVIGTPNPEMALKILQTSNSPELILLDVNMPQMNGYELCKLIKKDDTTKNIPVIFLTTQMSDEDEMIGFHVGAADYITKPFKPTKIKARIKTHITLRKKEAELEAKVAELEKSLRVFTNKITRTSSVKALAKELNQINEKEEVANLFLDDHVLDFAELEDIIDSRVNLMCLKSTITASEMHQTAQAIHRYGEILALYPIFLKLGSGLKDLANNLKTVEMAKIEPSRIKIALECLEALTFTLLHWRQQLLSGTLADPNAFDNSLLADVKTITNILSCNDNSQAAEIEFF